MNTTIPTQHQNVGRNVFDVNGAELLEALRTDLNAFRRGDYMNKHTRKRIVAVVIDKINELSNTKPQKTC